MTDPRIHERRVAVARQAGQRRRRRIFVGLVLATLAGLAFVLVHSPVFGARHVTVVGAPQVSTAAVIRAAGLESHPPLIDLDAAVIARRVERLPWVGIANVHITWPSSVSIHLTQRVPVAVVKEPDGRYAICDVTGRVLQVVVSRPSSLPLIGAGGAGTPGSSLADDGRVLATVAAAMPESLVPETTEVAVTSAGVVLEMTNGIEAIIGAPGALAQKFVSLATVLAHGGLSGVKTIDLRVATQPILIH